MADAGAAQIIGDATELAAVAEMEREWIIAARSDRQAFAPLYARYQESVLRFCRARLSTPEAAEDAASLIFTKAMIALPTHHQQRSFRGWLFAIARNVVMDMHRQTRPTHPLETSAEISDTAPTPEDVALANDRARELHALLAQLPSAQQRVVALRLAGLTGAEIAATLGCSVGAVKINQFRAVARLRTLIGVKLTAPSLEEDDGGEP